MPLIAATARFHTNDDDKDGETPLSIYVDGPMGRVAQVERIRGHFGRDTESGPFALAVVRTIAHWELIDCRVRVHIDPARKRPWQFDLAIEFAFSDANASAYRWNDLLLDDDATDFSAGLTDPRSPQSHCSRKEPS